MQQSDVLRVSRGPHFSSNCRGMPGVAILGFKAPRRIVFRLISVPAIPAAGCRSVHHRHDPGCHAEQDGGTRHGALQYLSGKLVGPPFVCCAAYAAYPRVWLTMAAAYPSQHHSSIPSHEALLERVEHHRGPLPLATTVAAGQQPAGCTSKKGSQTHSKPSRD